MRSLSLVDRLLFRGIHAQRSRNLCVADVDGDGDMELVVGFWDLGPLLENGEADVEHCNGCLWVTKYNRVWKVARDLGMILCVAAGPVLSKDVPWILALCTESDCYAFDARFPSEAISNPQHTMGAGLDPNNVIIPTTATTRKETATWSPLKLAHKQKLAHNAQDLCLITTGNVCELAVAYSHGVVQLYMWSSISPNREDWENETPSLGEFSVLIKWELTEQITRIDTHTTGPHTSILVASQPGGAFAVLERKFEKQNDHIVPTVRLYSSPAASSSDISDTRSWLVSNIRCGHVKSHPDKPRTGHMLVASCTSDGTVALVDPTEDDETKRLIWRVQLESSSELLDIAKLNFTDSDTDQVCVCSWDGTTYILDQHEEILRFPLGLSCLAFATGRYAVEPGRNEPVLVYATCDQNLLVYYNLNIGCHLSEHNLFYEIRESESICHELRALGINPEDNEQIQKVVHYLLYDYPTGIRNPFNIPCESSPSSRS